MNPERSADTVRYSRRAEDVVQTAHLNANEALVARLLAGVADWFADTYDSDLYAETLWEFVMDFAIPPARIDGEVAPGVPGGGGPVALVEALRWAVRDGRAHGVSACTCPLCRNARAVLRLAELAHQGTA